MSDITIKTTPFVSKSSKAKEFIEKNKDLDKMECLKYLVETIGLQYATAKNIYHANTTSQVIKRREEIFNFLDTFSKETKNFTQVLKKDLLIELQHKFRISNVTARKYLDEYKSSKVMS